MSCPCEDEVEIGEPNKGNPESEIEDPFCSPADPRVITYEQVRNARKTIESSVTKTPLVRAKLSDLVGMNIYLKCEFLQPTGSFKERGARYALMNLPEDKKKIGAFTASCGNHALALACHGRDLGIPITVVMPVTAPLMKIQRCKDFGADVVVTGNNLNESKLFAMRKAKDKGAIYINGYDYPDILAGQGTLGVEILEELPTANVIVIPVGGGGLIAGMAVAVKTLKPCTKVIGVESENCPSFSYSLKANRSVMTPAQSTVADGLSVPLPGYNAVATAKSLIDRMLTVKEDDVAVSILRLVEHEKYVVEGAGATSLAAVLSGQLNDFRGKNVVLVLSGGNIDTTVLGRALERGLAADGRYLKMYVTVSDRPDGIGELCRLIASVGVSVKSVEIERTWILGDIFSMKVKAVCETRDYEHALELEEILQHHYKEVDLVHADFPASTNVRIG